MNKKNSWGLAVLLLSLFLPHCTPTLDSVSSLNTLRILGVQKDKPYAREGQAVTLRMLVEDGAENYGRELETFWGFWCVNPAGDISSNCLLEPPKVEPQFARNQESFTLQIPQDIVRPVPSDPNQPPYGLVYVFYAVCAGELSFGGSGAGGAAAIPNASPLDAEEAVISELPQCLGSNGEPVGSSDFVVGFSAIYVFDDYRNENPLVLGMTGAGAELGPECIGASCEGQFDPASITGCEPGVYCVDVCKDDGETTCKANTLSVVVDRKSAEVDEVARDAYGNDLEESLWVSYFTDRGSIGFDLRLVNDASKGWQEDQSTEFYAPKEAGPIRLWAVVRDNRGGQSWIRVPAYARTPQ